MNFKPGDVVFRRGLSGPKFHFGIVAMRRGELTVIENQLGWGVREVPFAEFAAGLEVHVYDVPNRVYDADESVELARALKGQPYNPLSFHCEHFVTYVTTGKAESGQSAFWALIAALFDAPTPVLKVMLDAKPPEFPKKEPKQKASAPKAVDPVIQEMLRGYKQGQKLSDMASAVKEARQKKEGAKLAEFKRFIAQRKEEQARADAKRREDFQRLMADWKAKDGKKGD